VIRRELADLPYAAALTGYTGPWAQDETYDGIHVDGGAVADGVVKDMDAPHARFLECALTQVTIEGGSLRRARLNEVWMRDVRFVATDLAESEWLDVTVIGGVLAGAQAHGAHLRRVVVQGGKLDSVNLRSAGLTDVRFENCVLRGVDFAGAELTRVSFPGCRLSDVDLTGVTLTKVDLRGAELGITGDSGSLRGAVISTTQLLDLAPFLAAALGITVEDG
jgi:uncharacterized protein YjbI with pentapeptide repeats